jgi:two-component system chemotaxis family response regulator WspR
MTPPLETWPGRPAPRAGARGPAVLLVARRSLVAEAVRRLLATEAEIALHACEAAEALARTIEVEANVVVLDLDAPRADALALLQALRQHPATAAVPVIVLASKDEQGARTEAFARGANDFLIELPDRVELVARLRSQARSPLAERERDEAYRALAALREQLEASNAEVRRLSHLDGSTGVANRRWLDEQLNSEWRRAKRNGGLVSLALVGLDDFDGLARVAGVTAGEAILGQVAQALRATVRRGGDLLTRYGDQQFAALLPEVSHGGACKVAGSLRAAVAGLGLPHPGARGKVTVSVGLATVRPRGVTTANQARLLALADAALRRAERDGGDRVAAHDE